MVTEMAIFIAYPTKEDALGQAILRGLDVIRAHPECISAHATRSVEQPGRYLLQVVWSSFEAHMQDFRHGPLFTEWRKIIEGLYTGSPEVFHYQPF